jgi:cellulose biosynthesis protein BcsQ
MEAWQRRIAANAVRNGYHMKAIEVVGIQPVATNMQTVLHQEKYEGLRHQFGDKVLAPIAKRSAWAEAAAMGMSIFAYDPTSKAATEAWQIVNAVEAMEVSYD